MAVRKTIGKVSLVYLNDKPSEAYSEGAVEDELLELFKSPAADAKRRGILAGKPSWSQQYHLSPKRGTLVRWYDFKPGAKVFEVGAGCGAITEELTRKDVKVTALELTEKRSLVNAHRNKDRDNLTIIVGNLEEYASDEAYDYVVCVGVLEYAGSFISSPTPYVDFLKRLRDLVKPGGTMLLAIENRMGLKYFAGAREDHTSEYFDGLNGYPGDKGVQTFGRRELKELLAETGFKKADFYYPYPDYKMPVAVYSDSYLPGVNAAFPLHLLPAPAPDQPRRYLFSEQSAMTSLEANRLFADFSNSFLVAAS